MGLEMFVSDKVGYLHGPRLLASRLLPTPSMFFFVSLGRGSADVFKIIIIKCLKHCLNILEIQTFVKLIPCFS